WEGLEGIDERTRKAVEAAARPVREGQKLDEEFFATAEKQIVRALSERGHAYAQCQRRAQVDVLAHQAVLRFRVRPGPLNTYGKVRVEGLASLPEAPVRTALDIKEGKPFSTAELDEARVAVLDLGAFASVEVVPELGDEPREGPVPIVVRVQPSTLRSVKLGGGAEADVIRTDVHLAAGWEHKNFLGGFRDFQVTARPGVVFYPTRLPGFQAPTSYLPEVKINTVLGQPGFLEARTRGTLRVNYEIYPILLSPKVDPDASVIGYRELRASAGLERGFGPLFGNISLNLQSNTPFAYVGPLDKNLRSVNIPYVDLLLQYDRRNDKVKPRKGFYLSNDLQVAGGKLIGDATDVRVQPEARAYIPLPKKVTIALRASVGFLFPFDYGGTLASNAATGRPPPDVDQGDWVRDVQLVFFRAFFSGGPNSNRGYPLRGVGPHGVVPFFNPQLAQQSIANGCDVTSPNYEDARCSQPLGGLSLWESSLEVRIPIAGALHGATFCDASDVSPKKTQIRLNYLHLSCGLGIRYDTPVGPVRADVGVRIPNMQVLGKPDSSVEGNPDTIFSIPMAISLGIGEAFLW
ncbi:MAG: outer membrane protein assembly factor, partial [Myxococcales bacterium]